ncbi:MAG TPA: ABC transporter ATP-binding protein [bacterium]|jgi:ABC-2 type transport system ATP-binding protein|nr:ABC transporter ATP-binding protein [bacterium]
MIETQGLSRDFGAFSAVRSLDLNVPAACVYGFLGPNGAGKTTTIKMLTGLLKPSSGVIRLAGVDLAREPRRAKALTGYVPDRPELFEELSARETLRLAAGLHGLEPASARARGDGLLDAFSLLPFADEAVGEFSHGMKQKLAIACALLASPKIIILDEPMVGLDPQGGRQVKDLLRRLAQRGMTVFLSIHTLEIAEQLCDRLGVLLQGRLVAEGTPAQLREQAAAPGAGLEEVFLRLTGSEKLLDDRSLFGGGGA